MCHTQSGLQVGCKTDSSSNLEGLIFRQMTCQPCDLSCQRLICRYFAPPDAPSGTKGTTLRSVSHAVGPSFGTLSFGAAILTLVAIARNAMEQ